jgi:hypothetical protein
MRQMTQNEKPYNVQELSAKTQEVQNLKLIGEPKAKAYPEGLVNR